MMRREIVQNEYDPTLWVIPSYALQEPANVLLAGMVMELQNAITVQGIETEGVGPVLGCILNHDRFLE